MHAADLFCDCPLCAANGVRPGSSVSENTFVGQYMIILTSWRRLSPYLISLVETSSSDSFELNKDTPSATLRQCV